MTWARNKDQKKYAFIKKAYGITGFTASHHFINRPKLARAYLKMRKEDAVQCYKENKGKFSGPIDLAQHLCRYW